MRYLFGFLCVCVLGVVPLSASAQAGEEGTTSEQNLQEPASEEPALELKLDDAGVAAAPEAEVPDIATLSQRAIEDFEIQRAEKEKYERRRRRARRIGIPIAVAVVIVAVVFVAVGASYARSDFD